MTLVTFMYQLDFYGFLTFRRHYQLDLHDFLTFRRHFQLDLYDFLTFRRHHCPNDDLFGFGGKDRLAGGLLPDSTRLFRLHFIHVHLFDSCAGDNSF